MGLQTSTMVVKGHLQNTWRSIIEFKGTFLAKLLEFIVAYFDPITILMNLI